MSNKRKHKYNPKNCQHRIIAQFEDALGTKIALLAHHAFKWGIYKDVNGNVIIMQMSREEAYREYKKLELAYRPII